MNQMSGNTYLCRSNGYSRSGKWERKTNHISVQRYENGPEFGEQWVTACHREDIWTPQSHLTMNINKHSTGVNNHLSMWPETSTELQKPAVPSINILKCTRDRSPDTIVDNESHSIIKGTNIPFESGIYQSAAESGSNIDTPFKNSALGFISSNQLQESNYKDLYLKKCLEVKYLDAENRLSSLKIQSLKSDHIRLKNKFAKLQTSLKRVNEENDKLRKTNKSLTKFLNENKDKTTKGQVNFIKSVFGQKITDDEIKLLVGGNSGGSLREGQVKLTKEEINACLMLRQLSKKAYQFIREKCRYYPFPNNCILKRRSGETARKLNESKKVFKQMC